MADENDNQTQTPAAEAVAAPEGERRGRGGRGRGRDNRGGNRDGRGRSDEPRGNRDEDQGEEMIEKIVHHKRVSKKGQGGQRLGFAATRKSLGQGKHRSRRVEDGSSRRKKNKTKTQ